MGTQGEFKEYINTGSFFSDGQQKRYYSTANTMYSLSNPPPPSSLLIADTADHSGSLWQTILVVSASSFSNLSGSMQGAFAGVMFPAGTQIDGIFTDIKLASGIVIAMNENKL